MRRMSEMNLLTLLACLCVAVCLGLGCETKSKNSNGNGNAASSKNDNAAKDAGHDDAAMDDDASHDDMSHDDMSDASMMGDDTSGEEHMMDDPAAGHDDHDGHDHGDHAGHDHGAEDAHDSMSMSSADVNEDNLVDLAKLNIQRRPSGIRPTNKRDATADMIYATMRVQMDNLLMERKQLLDGGADSTDPDVRRREESIRKAVSLLTDNGEYVEPIEPPIEGLVTSSDDMNMGN